MTSNSLKSACRPRLPFPLLLILLAACGGGGVGFLAPESTPWVPVADASRVYYDNGAGLQDSLRMAIRDQSTLTALWRQATSQHSDPPPLPEVDFTREMLLLVAAGRMTPEDQIRVDSVSIRRQPDASGEVAEYLAAVVRITQGCGRFTTDAYPVEIVRIQRFNGEVRFLERRESAECAQGAVGR